MTGFFEIRVTRPELFDTAQVRARVLAVLNRQAKRYVQDLEAVTETWSDPPNFLIDRGFRGGNVYVEIWTPDDKFKWVDKGTRVRYATMTPDFQPKTRRGYIGSFSGKGGLAYVNKNIPRPGIQARNFSLDIRDRHRDEFRQEIADAIRAGLRAARRTVSSTP